MKDSLQNGYTPNPTEPMDNASYGGVDTTTWSDETTQSKEPNGSGSGDQNGDGMSTETTKQNDATTGNDNPDDETSNNMRMIIGLSVSGAVLAILLVAMVICIRKHKKKREEAKKNIPLCNNDQDNERKMPEGIENPALEDFDNASAPSRGEDGRVSDKRMVKLRADDLEAFHNASNVKNKIRDLEMEDTKL